jgi:regulatory protein
MEQDGGRRAPTRDALRASALRMLALRDHARAELERKLARPRGTWDAPDPGLLRQVLDELQAQGLLDEARFAQVLARRVARRHGRARVLGELRRHGLDEALISRAAGEALGELEPESERALRLLLRHHPLPPADAAQRARQMRFLQARGFGSEAIRAALRQRGTLVPDSDTGDDAGD